MNPPESRPEPRRELRPGQGVLFVGGAVVDAGRMAAAPGAVLLRRGPSGTGDGRVYPWTLLAAGKVGEVEGHPEARGAMRVERPRSVLLPATVNAHAHLDLTHIGPRPYDPVGGFMGWVDVIRTERRSVAAEIAESVRMGTVLSRRAGVAAVGDIAGAPLGQPSLEPARALAASGLLGTSFVEFFAIGKSRGLGVERVRAVVEKGREFTTHERVRLGLQPHAPNTVELDAFWDAIAIADEHRLDLSTHLAETPDEREFVGKATGPQRRLLERLGLWEERLGGVFGRGLSAVEHMRKALERATFLAAHVNDADDAAIELLARTGVQVAYCPRASAYFGAEKVFGPHRYRDMLSAGVRVALGTDSIVNLPPEARERGLSILDEARFLRARDGTPALTLLAMATRLGASALSLDTRAFMFRPRISGTPCAGVVATTTGESPKDATAEGLASLIFNDGGVDEFLSDSILY